MPFLFRSCFLGFRVEIIKPGVSSDVSAAAKNNDSSSLKFLSWM
uniref:Uncharacterized protein n=1 Tax=Rhizophora mucronata TaxID=61149 RepID=A0A2P2PZK2_RHIMU